MLQRVSRNQKGHTFALGSVNWEQPGHRTAGSVLQKVNRSYHSIWPLQCWDSAGGKCIIRKDTSTPVFTATLFIMCQDCMHTQSPFSEMDGWTRGTRTHTHTHTDMCIHSFTGIGQHNQKVGKMSFPATWTEMLTTGEATQIRFASVNSTGTV